MHLLSKRTILVASIWSVITSLIVLNSCGSGSKAKSSASKSSSNYLVTFQGFSFIPSILLPWMLYRNNMFAVNTSPAWTSCVADKSSPKSQVSSTSIVMESTNTCSGQQYLYLENSSLMDLSNYSTGKLVFTVEASNLSQTLTVFMQGDGNALSNQIDISTYGFDKTKAGTVQTVYVPILELTKNSSLNLKMIKRPFQLNVSCSSSQCLTKINDVKFIVGTSTGLTRLVSNGMHLAKRANYCDSSQACRSVSRGNIQLIKPTDSGWELVGTSLGASSDDGEYSVSGYLQELIDPVSNAGLPIFLAITEPMNNLTFVSKIPYDKMLPSKGVISVDLDIDLSTSMIAFMECPGGDTAVPGSCFVDPFESKFLDAENAVIDSYWKSNAPASSNILTILEEVASNSTIKSDINHEALANGGSPISISEIIANNEAIPPPEISKVSVPAGDYTISIKSCPQGGTCTTSSQSLTISNASTDIATFIAGVSQSCTTTAQTDGSCLVSYTAFDGSSFSAMWSLPTCTDSLCPSTTTIASFSKP